MVHCVLGTETLGDGVGRRQQRESFLGMQLSGETELGISGCCSLLSQLCSQQEQPSMAPTVGRAQARTCICSHTSKVLNHLCLLCGGESDQRCS